MEHDYSTFHFALCDPFTVFHNRAVKTRFILFSLREQPLLRVSLCSTLYSSCSLMICPSLGCFPLSEDCPPPPTGVYCSTSSVSTHLFSRFISRICILRPAGVSACLPAPHPYGSTSRRLPFLSNTTRASSGNLPPPRGCSSPKRTK